MSSIRPILLAFFTLVVLYQLFRFSTWSPPPIPRSEFEHPIPKLMADAELKYTTMLENQSKTLEEAVAEYRRRYDIDPPKGFHDWYAFAVENNVKIIDEYDGLMEDLEPFRGLPGEELRRRIDQVGSLPSVDLVRLRNGTSETVVMEKAFTDDEIKIAKVGNPRAKGFRVMMEKFQNKLPDMDFPINTKAEGRVLVPWEHKQYPNMTQQNSSGEQWPQMIGQEFVPDWKSDGSVWEAYRRTCDPSSQARRLFGSIRGQTALSAVSSALHSRIGHSYIKHAESASLDGTELTFATRPDDDYDFCSHPWAKYQQGHFFSDWRTIPVLYPVFSPGKAPGFSDIRIPSHYYYSSTTAYTYGWDRERGIVHDVDKNEVPWEKKTNLVFWRGSTTGGGSSPPGFVKSYQRHRFMEMSSTPTNATRPVVFTDPPGSDHFVSADVPLAKLNAELMDTAFTKGLGCESFPGGCGLMKKLYRFAPAVPLGEHWKHKYLVDFDGMGYSGRSMAFLASESVLVKSTVYREFFSDWIQPWLHYIPLSQTYSEIYNIRAFFSGPSSAMLKAANSTSSPLTGQSLAASDGDKRLRHIAQASREWKHTVGRKVDMETYVYRLCLEWARLYADDRDAMSYKG
ncbi:glycosyltransferase family 90 protein [Sphaerobolus stellatus SS14]|uniref:Glycosyltransferase family 90 protein n=1 Tax=Sphaerobolus stellatus (strain SS14) TaxID=990650 RepID=A0A0C9VXY2_SPHS4|nr:glycosyltransferase family 90 protein [Sphaerobolus stellatus SS14]